MCERECENFAPVALKDVHNCKKCEKFKRKDPHYSDECKNYQPKDDTIYVPEGIKFYESRDPSKSLFLEFGDRQGVGYSHNAKGWMVGFTDRPGICGQAIKIKTKLTPYKRNELKPGDWAYSYDEEKPNGDHHASYRLCVGIYGVTYNRFVHITGVNGVEPYNMNDKYWFKVEKV